MQLPLTMKHMGGQKVQKSSPRSGLIPVSSHAMMCVLTGAVEVRKELADRTELDLPATLLFDYPSPSELAAFILSMMPPPLASKPIPAAPSAAAPASFRISTAGLGIAGLSFVNDVQSDAAVRAHPVWWYMGASQRTAWATEVVRDVVVKILGKDLDASQPLMMAGLDSLGASQCAQHNPLQSIIRKAFLYALHSEAHAKVVFLARLNCKCNLLMHYDIHPEALQASRASPCC